MWFFLLVAGLFIITYIVLEDIGGEDNDKP